MAAREVNSTNPERDAEIVRLHSLKRSDSFIAGATGLTERGISGVRYRLGLATIPQAETSDHEVEQRSPGYIRWLAAKDQPGGVQKMIQEAREAFLEDNGIMIQIVQDAMALETGKTVAAPAQQPQKKPAREPKPTKPPRGSRTPEVPRGYNKHRPLPDELILETLHFSQPEAAELLGVTQSLISKRRKSLREGKP